MKKKKLIILAVVLVFLSVFLYWQNNHLDVTEYEFSHPQIDEKLTGYRIVQISDLHNKKFGKDNGKLLKEIKSCTPDMIVITGDLVDSGHTDIQVALDFCKNAIEIAPVYYITGNHENWLSDNKRTDLINGMKALGVCVLEDMCIQVAYNGTYFNLIGLDDGSLRDNTLENIMKDVNSDYFTLLLAHEPQYLEDYSNFDIDLILSGHAHGGQIRLPFVGGLVAPDQGILPEYTSGEYVKGETVMYVSRGLGNSVVPFRLFNFPEVVCVELVGGQ